MRSTASLLSILGVLSLVGLVGCTGGDPLAASQDTTAATPQAALESLRETLFAERPTIATYRNAVQQVNAYLDQMPNELRGTARPADQVPQLKALAPGIPDEELKTFPLAPEEVRRLRNLLPPSTRDEDMKAILGRNFTVLDAHHLDAAFLFRDAAQALRQHLGEEPLPLAADAFAWVMRHVDLQPRPRNVGDWPAHDILRRGTGDAEERLRVFLALLNQLRIEGGALTRTVVSVDRERNTVRRVVPWLAVVLHQGELYLFDPVAGHPVWKDAAHTQIATWTDVKAQPDLLARHLQGRTDVTPAKELTEGNLLWLDVTLTAFAPRMKWLQERLVRDRTSTDLHVRLYQDLDERLKNYDINKLGVRVQPWAREDRPGYPIRLLTEYIQETLRTDRGRQSLLRPVDVVVPWHVLPTWLRDDRTRTGLYYDLMSDAEKQELLATGRMTENDVQRRLMAGLQNLFFEIRLAPGGQRDLLVRGRPERVVQRVLDAENGLDRILHQLHQLPNQEPELRSDWGAQVAKVERQLMQTRDALLRAKQTNSPDARRLEQELMAIGRGREKLWAGQEVRLRQLCAEWGQAELREHMTYYMALAKTDLAVRAERAQGRRAATTPRMPGELSPLECWQAALFWYRRYEARTLPRGTGVWLHAVRRQIQECEAAIQRLGGAKAAS